MKTDEVYQKVKDQIVYGHIRPGDTLTVGALAAEFQVSNTPVRDSLNALKHEGFIDVLPYKGYLVTRIDTKALRDLFQMRVILEGAVVALVTQLATDAQHRELWTLATTSCVGEVAPNPAEPMHAKMALLKGNLQFHMKMASMSGNQILADALGLVLNQLQRVLYLDLVETDPEQMQREHTELVERIRAGDATASKQAVTLHIETTYQRLLQKI